MVRERLGTPDLQYWIEFSLDIVVEHCAWFTIEFNDCWYKITNE